MQLVAADVVQRFQFTAILVHGPGKEVVEGVTPEVGSGQIVIGPRLRIHFDTRLQRHGIRFLARPVESAVVAWLPVERVFVVGIGLLIAL